MANTYTLIEAKTLGSTTATITFSAIPQTYTDLKLVNSTRCDLVNSVAVRIAFNSNTSNFTGRYLQGAGSGTPSTGNDGRRAGVSIPTTYTASTFTNDEIYIPNYTSANFKSYSLDATQENNATLSYAEFYAGLWSDTAAITSITLTLDSSGSFVANSTFYLYGIKNS